MWEAWAKGSVTEFWELQPLILPMEDTQVSAVNGKYGEIESIGGTARVTACSKRAGQKFTRQQTSGPGVSGAGDNCTNEGLFILFSLFKLIYSITLL